MSNLDSCFGLNVRLGARTRAPLAHIFLQRIVRHANGMLSVTPVCSSLEELARRNVTVTSLSNEEKSAFARVTRPVYDKWAQTVGPDLVRRAEAAVRGARA